MLLLKNIFVVISQNGGFEKGATVAVRSSDTDIFWLAEIIEHVPAEDVRWAVQYFCFIKQLADGSTEYRRGSKVDTIWRDVILCDVSAFVRVHGSKLMVPESITAQIQQHAHGTESTPQTSSNAMTREVMSTAMLSLEEMKTVINSTRVAQNMVSIHRVGRSNQWYAMDVPATLTVLSISQTRLAVQRKAGVFTQVVQTVLCKRYNQLL